MTQRSHVPQFGNWENEEDVPYTMYFDKARKGRTGGKIINPNDPEENPDIISDNEARPPAAAPPKTIAEPEKSLGQGAARTIPEQRRNQEDGDFRQFRDSPARRTSTESTQHSDFRQFRDSPARRTSSESTQHSDFRQFRDSPARRTSGESTHQRQGQGVRVPSSGEANKRPVRYSAESDNSFEKSPLHHQARNPGRGNLDPSSPAWEGKGLYKNSHGTPGRSRLKARGDESPDAGAAVPKFGEWDENDPASADGYTHIFNKVRQERNNGPRAPGMSSPSPYNNVHRQTPNDSAKSCCFFWGRK